MEKMCPVCSLTQSRSAWLPCCTQLISFHSGRCPVACCFQELPNDATAVGCIFAAFLVMRGGSTEGPVASGRVNVGIAHLHYLDSRRILSRGNTKFPDPAGGTEELSLSSFIYRVLLAAEIEWLRDQGVLLMTWTAKAPEVCPLLHLN